MGKNKCLLITVSLLCRASRIDPSALLDRHFLKKNARWRGESEIYIERMKEREREPLDSYSVKDSIRFSRSLQYQSCVYVPYFCPYFDVSFHLSNLDTWTLSKLLHSLTRISLWCSLASSLFILSSSLISCGLLQRRLGVIPISMWFSFWDWSCWRCVRSFVLSTPFVTLYLPLLNIIFFLIIIS